MHSGVIEKAYSLPRNFHPAQGAWKLSTHQQQNILKNEFSRQTNKLLRFPATNRHNQLGRAYVRAARQFQGVLLPGDREKQKCYSRISGELNIDGIASKKICWRVNNIKGDYRRPVWCWRRADFSDKGDCVPADQEPVRFSSIHCARELRCFNRRRFRLLCIPFRTLACMQLASAMSSRRSHTSWSIWTSA